MLQGINYELRDVFFINPQIGWAAGLGALNGNLTGVLLYTTDGGASWQAYTSGIPVFLNAIHFTDSLQGWAAGGLCLPLVGCSSVIYHTTDGGASWVQQLNANGNSEFRDIYFADSLRGWAVGPGLFRTTNGGQTWVGYQHSPKNTVNAVHFPIGNRGWIVGNSGMILESSDGGLSWQIQQSPVQNNLFGVYFIDNKQGWVVGDNGIILQTSDGKTWTKQTSGTSARLTDVHFTDAKNGWAVGEQGTILHTTDGGIHWHLDNSGTSNVLYAVHFIDYLTGWSVGASNLIYKYETVPTAAFSFSANGTSVSFVGPSANTGTFFWEFGDGQTDTLTSPTHNYSADGTYTVKLTVANSCGTSTATQTIVVATPPTSPVAAFTASPVNGCAPLTVQYVDASSPNTSNWTWQFPGGTPSSSTDQNPAVTYNTPGVYSVTLTVSNAAGTDSVTQTNYITVNTLPTASFTAQVTGSNASFINSSLNANWYYWAAPGGTPSSSAAQNLTVMYPAPGSYSVTLTAVNACGTSIAVRSIAIVPSSGGRLYVDRDAVFGFNNGTSWADAYLDVQDAINAVLSGDTIWVAEGVYLPTQSYGGATNRHRTFYIIDKNIAIYGGFNATETSLSQRDWAKHPTILSGDIGVPGDASDNAYHVIYMQNLPSTARLDGFAITSGRADGTSSPEDYGGGIYNEDVGNIGSSPLIVNCRFTDNWANAGGAIVNYGVGSATMLNCLFYANEANYGGAIANAWSSPLLINCSVVNNSAYNGGAMFSLGGLGNGASNPILINCIVWGNSATNIGPVFYNFGATVSVKHSLTDAVDCTVLNSGSNGNMVVCDTGMVYNVQDPLFVDAPNGDLRLQAGSPAIDKGDNNAIPTFITADLGGNPRISNGRVDIGVYEFDIQTPCSILTLVINTAEGPVGSALKIPVTAAACFDSLGLAHGAVRLGNAGSFKLLGLEDAVLKNVAGSLIDDSTLTWLWVFSADCQSLSQGDTLFYILVEVNSAAQPGDCTAVYFDDFLPSLPLEARRCDGNSPFGVQQAVTTTAGAACVLNQVQLCGVVTHVTGPGALANVQVFNLSNSSDTTVATDSNGSYQLNGQPAGDNYLVAPYKSSTRCITGADVFMLASLLQSKQFTTIYEKPAADITGNGIINAEDLNALITVLLNPNAVLPWVFVATQGSPLVDPGGLLVPIFNSFYFLPNQLTDTCGLDFGAILRGALSPASLACAANSAYKPSARSNDLIIPVEIECREKEGLVLYRLKTKGWKGIGAVQIPLLFNPEQLEFLDIQAGTWGECVHGAIYQTQNSRNVLPLLWYATNQETANRSMEDETTLITLVFASRVNASAERPSLGIAEEPALPPEAYDSDGTRVPLHLDLTATLNCTDMPRMSPAQPNPFIDETVIPVYLPGHAADAEIRISDVNGREFKRISVAERGEVRVPVRSGEMTKGIYFYSLFVDGVLISTQRMVVQ